MMQNHYGDKLHVIFINFLEHLIFVLQVWISDASMFTKRTCCTTPMYHQSCCSADKWQ